jgi:cytoskeleton protein RodZ
MLLEKQQQSVGMFGERLRREREMRGVSLEEIAHATKIGTRLLRALEDEQFDLLPGGIFNKGFVRAYAKYLGINEEQAVADYLQAAGEADPDLHEFAQNQFDNYARNAPETSGRSGFPLVPVVILLVVVGTGFAGWKLYQQYRSGRDNAVAGATSKPEPSTATGANSTVPSSATAQPDRRQTSAPSAAGSAGSVGKAPATGAGTELPATIAGGQPTKSATTPGATGKTFQVVVHTTGPAWMSIKADGKFAVRGILQPDQTRTIVAAEEIELWTGNAGVTQVSFQGNPVSVGGRANEVKLLVFKPDGLQPTPPPKPPAVIEPSAQSTPEATATPR